MARLGVRVLVRASLVLMSGAEQLARWARTTSPTPTLDDLLREVAEEYSDVVRAPGGVA